MDNNIFLKSNNNYNIDNISNSKFNPDVMQRYNNSKSRKVDYNFVNEYYKSVTNEPVKTNIKNILELKLERDSPDIKKCNNDYQNIIYQHTMEQDIVRRSREDYINMNNIKVKTVEELDIEYQEKQKKEAEELNNRIQKSIIENKELEKLNNNKPSNNEIIITDYDNIIEDHNKLRNNFQKYSIKENDKLIKQKERYNNILKDLDNLI